jgi:hypothetical protein
VALPAGKYQKWLVNGKTVNPQTTNNLQTIEASGKEIKVEVE